MKLTRFQIFTAVLAALAIMLLTLLPSLSLAQDAAGNPQSGGGDPCAGDAVHPINFQLTPGSGPAGSTFLIKGRPHDLKTVGPGSDVDFIWREDTAGQEFTAPVDANQNFETFIKVPASFSPGPHQLMYEEGSPYTQCVTFTVTAGTPAASASLPPQLVMLINFLVGILMML